MHSLAHNQGVVEGVGAQEVLWVVVGVNNDLACKTQRVRCRYVQREYAG